MFLLSNKAVERRGYATVLVMLLLVLGSTICAWLYTMVSNATAIAHNEIDAARAQMAASSGLVYMRNRIETITRGKKLKGKTPEELLEQLAGELAGKIPGNVTVALDGNGVPYLKTYTVALGDGMSFAAWLAPSSRVSYDFSLSVQGNCGRHSSAKWILGMEALQEGSNAISALHFPMASKRQITLQSAATNVYRGDSNVKAQKPATKATNSADGSDAYVLQWEDDPNSYAGQEIRFPELPPSAFYYAIDTLFPDAPAGENANTSQKDTINVSGRKIIRYSGAQEHTFSDSSFTGVIYVKWPGKLAVTAGTTINGMIIFEPAPSGLPADAQTTPSYLALDRDLPFTLNTSNILLKRELESRGLWDETQDYATIDWAILAPHTAFKFDKNQKQQKTINNGSVNIFSAGNNGNWKKPLTINNGSMILEGPFASNGTFDLRITPAASGDDSSSRDSGYILSFDSSSYWER